MSDRPVLVLVAAAAFSVGNVVGVAAYRHPSYRVDPPRVVVVPAPDTQRCAR